MFESKYNNISTKRFKAIINLSMKVKQMDKTNIIVEIDILFL